MSKATQWALLVLVLGNVLFWLWVLGGYGPTIVLAASLGAIIAHALHGWYGCDFFPASEVDLMSGRRTSELLSAIAGAYDDQRVAEELADVPVWEPTPATTAQIAAATTHVCPICGRIHLPPEPDEHGSDEVNDYIEKVTKPEPGDVFEGISYPVQLRATPARDADGLPADWREVMWSADLTIEEGIGLTASASTPEAALDRLQDVIANHTRPFPEPDNG